MDVGRVFQQAAERVSTGQRWALGLALAAIGLWVFPGWLALQVIESDYNSTGELIDRAFGMFVLIVHVLLMLAACVVGFFSFRRGIVRCVLVLLLLGTVAGAHPVLYLLNSGRFPWEPAPPMYTRP